MPSSPSTGTQKKTIAILGAGFGGLRAATLIDRAIARKHLSGYDVVLIDRSEHQTYTPLLYEAATTSKETASACDLHDVIAHRFAQLVRGTKIVFRQAEIAHILAAEGLVRFTDGSTLRADYLVLALGAETNYFDIPGLQTHALPLKTMLDAIRIRDAITNLAMAHERSIRIVVGGGGPTGLELAGELKTWAGELDHDFQSRLDVDLVQGAPTILPGFPAKIIRLAKLRLRRLGVRIMENERITTVSKTEVRTASGRALPFDILVWTGGVKPPSIIAEMPLKRELRGRIEVSGDMLCLPASSELRLGTRIYGLGDSICAYHPLTRQPAPGVARAALSQAKIVAHNIVSELEAEQGLIAAPRRLTYHPMNYPYITPIGGKYAIAKIGPFVFAGFFGWLLKGLVELNYLFSIMPFREALVSWAKGLRIFIQNDRLG